MKTIGKKKKAKGSGGASGKAQPCNALFLAEYSGTERGPDFKAAKGTQKRGGEFKVAKNTLLKIASAGTQAEGLKDQFAGPNAMIYIYKDPVGVAKVLQVSPRTCPS